jgi:hypothetical protein
VKLASPAAAAVLDFGGARVSFTGTNAGGGLELGAYGGRPSEPRPPPVCTLSGLRIAGEDWIELGPARYLLGFSEPVDRVTLVFGLSDSAPAASVRADINTVSIRPAHAGVATLPCPPAVR